MKRGLFGILLILSAFITPWWIPVILSLAGLFYFDHLYEVILVGLIIDLLYGVKYEIWGFSLIFTLALTVCFYVISKFKTQIFV